MKKNVLLIILAFVVGTLGFTIGWYKGLGYHAVTSYIAHGTVELQAIKAIQSNDLQKAIEWLEKDVVLASQYLISLNDRIPAKYKEGARNLIVGAERLGIKK